MRVTTASAGTGKTTALTLRVLDLIRSGTPLRRIASVTFTRASAAELRQRIRDALQQAVTTRAYMHLEFTDDELPFLEEALRESTGSVMTTIHGFMGVVIRLVAPSLMVDPGLRVLEAWEGNRMFEQEMTTLLALADEDGTHPAHDVYNVLREAAVDIPATLMSLFNARQLAPDLASAGTPLNDALKSLYEQVYERFSHRLGTTLVAPAEVERKAIKAAQHKYAATRIASRFRHVLVDEYQDVNPMQASFFEALEAAGVTIEVVGDPKQSIYLFRNADVEMFRQALQHGHEGDALTTSYRHSRVLTRFLNKLTHAMGEASYGFSTSEAPEITAARDEFGNLEIHYVTGTGGLAELRRTEAQVMAERLHAEHNNGTPWNDMAVLVRGGSAMITLAAGLDQAGVPYVMTQGKQYYQRQEVIDIIAALRVATRPRPQDWLVFLRGPYANLKPEHIADAMHDDKPGEHLRQFHPELAERIDKIRDIASGYPGDVLADLSHARIIHGQSLLEMMTRPARDNVTHLARTLSKSQPVSLSHLIDELERLSSQTEASDMPQAADAVQISTIHSSKGLEWPVVGVFDLGAHPGPNQDPISVDPNGKAFALRGTDPFDGIVKARKELEQQEAYRLLYVAVSRARDRMILTGSYARRQGPLLAALNAAEFGPDQPTTKQRGFTLQHHEHDPANLPNAESTQPQGSVAPISGLIPAPWTGKTFESLPMPPVNSPTRHKNKQDQAQPLPGTRSEQPALAWTGDAEPQAIALDEDEIPDRARVIGTLAHYGISVGWHPDNPDHVKALNSQSLLHPYTKDDKQELVNEILDMLRNYHALIAAGELTAPSDSDEHIPEIPVQLARGGTVWTGIIDRLYRVGNDWVLEDYKTDGQIKPERYHFQLGLYAHAVERLKGVRPKVQLVYVRRNKVVPLEDAALREAFEGALPEPPEPAAAQA